MDREYRYIALTDVSVRSEPGNNPEIHGYAVVFDSEAVIGDYFREIVRKGAFSRALQENQDVRALINHDPNLVLGRTQSGTLTLEEDEKGLRFSVIPPDTQAARDLLVSLNRGDVDGMSFGFMAVKEEWSEQSATLPLRAILDADLTDVSIVTYPAYKDTTVAVRSAADVFNEYKESHSDVQEHIEENRAEETISQEAEVAKAMLEIERAKYTE